MNDGTQNAPHLKVFMNAGTLDSLPENSRWNQETGTAVEKLQRAGFEGLQGNGELLDSARAAGMAVASDGGVRAPEQAEPLAAQKKAEGVCGITVHVGRGFEDDALMDDYAAAIIEASNKHQLPIFVETHRATLTQDIWRTLRWIERNPGIRFNGDYSHYYTGHEMRYGDWEGKMEMLEPLFERVGFMHGRIGNSGCIQVPVRDESDPENFVGRLFLTDFKEMWTRTFRGFLKQAGPGDFIALAPELLRPHIDYARYVHGVTMPFGIEENDRFAEAIRYKDIARECWEDAVGSTLGGERNA